MSLEQISLAGLLFISREGGTDKVDDLVGRKFSSIASGDHDVIAVCNDGIHGINLKEVSHISPSEMVFVSTGTNFFVSTDKNRSLYTWGTNGYSGQVLKDLNFYSTTHIFIMSFLRFYNYDHVLND